MKLKTLAAISLFLCLFAFACGAQTNSQSTNAPVKPTTVDQIINLIGGTTNFAVEPYATYAPQAPQKFGGGILGIYNVNNYVGLGIGLDWLGSFSLVSANVQLQAPFHPFLSSGNPTLAGLVLSPFVLGGIATPYSGGGNFNGAAVTIEDVGAYIRIGHLWGGQFNTGAAYGKWTGSGPYDVARYHAFAGYSHGF